MCLKNAKNSAPHRVFAPEPLPLGHLPRRAFKKPRYTGPYRDKPACLGLCRVCRGQRRVGKEAEKQKQRETKNRRYPN
jgi:hypothetical protein